MSKRWPFVVAGVITGVACSSSSSPDNSNSGDGGGGPEAGAEAAVEASSCTLAIADSHEADRGACKFVAGAKVADTLGDVAALRSKIGHVVVMMKENRSYDMILGELSKVLAGAEPTPATFANPDATGASVARFHQTNTCVPLDPEHQWDNQHANWDDGKLDGFVKNAAANTVDGAGVSVAVDGHFVMGYYDQGDLPFYYWLASHYAVADHYFCSAISGTWSNRLFLYAGSSYGVKRTAVDFAPSTMRGKTLFDALDAAGIDYGIYSDDLFPLDGAMISIDFVQGHKGVHPTQDFFAAASAGTLPKVVFIDALENKEDEHPPADVQLGEAWSKKVYDAVTSSPTWLESNGKATVLFYAYDENGSFADHVPPPTACAPSSDLAEWDHLGFRVPMVAISPYAKKAYVSKTVHSHTSITRFISALYDLPAMSARDANSDALLDMFDFGCAPGSPSGAPAAGTGGCQKPDGGPDDAGDAAPSDASDGG